MGFDERSVKRMLSHMLQAIQRAAAVGKDVRKQNIKRNRMHIQASGILTPVTKPFKKLVPVHSKYVLVHVTDVSTKTLQMYVPCM